MKGEQEAAAATSLPAGGAPPRADLSERGTAAGIQAEITGKRPEPRRKVASHAAFREPIFQQQLDVKCTFSQI